METLLTTDIFCFQPIWTKLLPWKLRQNSFLNEQKLVHEVSKGYEVAKLTSQLNTHFWSNNKVVNKQTATAAAAAAEDNADDRAIN